MLVHMAIQTIKGEFQWQLAKGPVFREKATHTHTHTHTLTLCHTNTHPAYKSNNLT